MNEKHNDYFKSSYQQEFALVARHFSDFLLWSKESFCPAWFFFSIQYKLKRGELFECKKSLNSNKIYGSLKCEHQVIQNATKNLFNALLWKCSQFQMKINSHQICTSTGLIGSDTIWLRLLLRIRLVLHLHWLCADNFCCKKWTINGWMRKIYKYSNEKKKRIANNYWVNNLPFIWSGIFLFTSPCLMFEICDGLIRTMFAVEGIGLLRWTGDGST